MPTNWETVSSLATGAGTLVLAVATFASVRSANRAARASETSMKVAQQSMMIGLRPVLMPSRQNDSMQKIMFGDQQWFKLPGGAAIGDIRGEDGDETVYLAISVRNAGNGLAVIHGWRFYPERPTGTDQHHPPPEDFRMNFRDLYIPVNDIGFWQAAYREKDDPEYAAALAAVKSRSPIGIDLLYGDQQGGQRVITRFSVTPRDAFSVPPSGEGAPARTDADGDSSRLWITSVVRHWNVDRSSIRPGEE